MQATLSRRYVLGMLPAMAAAGCGYTLAGRGSFLPAYIQTIGIPAFANTTPFATVEQIFTDKVRAEFQSRGQYSVVPTDTGADGVVRGTITGIGASPVGFTDAQLARRYRFSITLAVAFEDARQQKKLWENPALSFADEYELASSIAGLDTSAILGQERAAIDRLATDFARSVVSAILEAF
ncbi:MAG: LptE family protein [Acidobacteria bacterium]|nr:LptE family protein [Acidobacteriota bacterium]